MQATSLSSQGCIPGNLPQFPGGIRIVIGVVTGDFLAGGDVAESYRGDGSCPIGRGAGVRIGGMIDEAGMVPTQNHVPVLLSDKAKPSRVVAGDSGEGLICFRR